MAVHIKPNSRAAAAYRNTESFEQYYCNFGLNPDHTTELESAGLTISGIDKDDETRIMEIATQRFFMGTLFVPQARSTPEHPHPLLTDFCQAAANISMLYADGVTSVQSHVSRV